MIVFEFKRVNSRDGIRSKGHKMGMGPLHGSEGSFEGHHYTSPEIYGHDAAGPKY